MAEFARDHRDEFTAWITGSNYIVILAVPDEQALLAHTHALARDGLAYNLVFEPDIGEHTAVVIAPGPYHSRLSDLPLAGKELVMS